MLVFVAIAIKEICSKAIPSTVNAVLLISPYDSTADDQGLGLIRVSRHDELAHESRQKRQAYDPYYNYPQYQYPQSYSGYSGYNDYYEPQGSSYEPESRPKPKLKPRRRQDELADSEESTKKGNKYVYQPLFQYKSTEQKRRKLFVPNLFG